MRKVEIDSKTWKERVKEVLNDFGPTIMRCPKCGSPAVDFAVCSYCDYDEGEYEEAD